MIKLLALFAFATICMIFAGVAAAEDDKPVNMQEVDMNELMEMYMKLAEPTEEHAFLAKYAGDWDCVVTMWMSPGAEPSTQTGTSHTKTVLGGRFLYSEWHSGEGMFEGDGIGYMGFDTRKKEYMIMGMDSYGTYWITAYGQYDEATKTMTLAGTDYDPILGFNQEFKFVYHFESDDSFTVENYFTNKEMTGGGDAFKMMEIKYTRKK